MSVSGRDGYSFHVGIQVTLCDGGLFLHFDLKGQGEKGYAAL